MIYWIVGFNLTFDVHKKPDTFTLLNHYTVIIALAFRIIVNKKKALLTLSPKQPTIETKHCVFLY